MWKKWSVQVSVDKARWDKYMFYSRKLKIHIFKKYKRTKITSKEVLLFYLSFISFPGSEGGVEQARVYSSPVLCLEPET